MIEKQLEFQFMAEFDETVGVTICPFCKKDEINIRNFDIYRIDDDGKVLWESECFGCHKRFLGEFKFNKWVDCFSSEKRV